MNTTQTCVNCQEPVSSHYCPMCGQKVDVKPITWRGLVLELSSSWLGTDNRVYRTFAGMTVRPQIVISEYLQGNRVKYMTPLSYLIFMSFMYLLSFQVLGLSPKEMFEEAIIVMDYNQPESQRVFMEKYVQVISENMRLLTGLMVPLLALSLNMFYKSRNYLQHFLFSAYLVSHLIWLNLLNNVLYVLTGSMYLKLALLLSLVYYAWVIGRLNTQKSAIWTYAKGLLVWLVAYVFYVLFMVVTSAVVVGIQLSQS